LSAHTVDRDAIVREIVGAFDGVRRGDGISLHEAQVIEDHGSDNERVRARTLDAAERWQDVPGADIEAAYDILSFLDAAGFRYYLPAYMVWSLENFETSESRSVDHTIYSLALHEEPRLRQWQLGRFSVFDPRQAKAIARFLAFMAERSGGLADAAAAAAALADHWTERAG
jgi:hypothetical protein